MRSTPVIRSSKHLASALLACAITVTAGDLAARGELRLSSGGTYTTGDYGTDMTTEIWHFPVSAQYRYQRLTAKVTVPYMRITRKLDDFEQTVSGMGDTKARLKFRLLNEGDWHPSVALTGQAKLPTADDDLGLNDEDVYYAQIDLGKQITYRNFLFASFGYQTRNADEEDVGIDREERHYGSIGLNHQITERAAGGLIINANQAWTGHTAQSTGVMAIPYLSTRLSSDWRLQTYAIGGLSESAPEWGAGLSISYDID